MKNAFNQRTAGSASDLDRFAGTLVGVDAAEIEQAVAACGIEREVLESDAVVDRGGIKLDVMHGLNESMQSIESEADRLLLDLYKRLFSDAADAARLMVRRDLFELLEKAIDRCRDAGNVIYQIALKNS